MTDKKVWLITGAGRGLGVDIAKAVLAAGHAVVATGRDPAKVEAAIGTHPALLCVRLDITQPDEAETAIAVTVEKFGRLDVLVNNAGNFEAGFFEELSPRQVRDQIDVLLFGPMHVTRAALPVMRKARSGVVMTISSTAGAVGMAFCSAYSAGKFAVEGWMEALAGEVEPFGIKTCIVEPGLFRTELLSAESTRYAETSIDDYADRTRATVEAWKAMHGQQGGDPRKLADALVAVASMSNIPARFAAGADAVEAVANKGRTLVEQAGAHRPLSSSMAFDS